MKTNRLLLVLTVLLFSQCDTNNNVEPRYEDFFIKYYGTDGDQFGVDMLVNDDGTMVLLGNSILPSGASSPFLLKVDPLGNVLWELSFGENELAVDVETIRRGTYQNNFIVATNVGSEESSKSRLWRISAAGALIDSVTIPNTSTFGHRHFVNSVTSLELQDGYVITGYADSGLNSESSPNIDLLTDRDILAFRIDDSFSAIENIVSKGGEMNGAGVKIFEMPENPSGQMILFSYTDRPFLTNTFGFNFSYDILVSGVPVGNLVGTEEEREILSSVIRTPPAAGAGFLLAGTATVNNGTTGNIYLVKFNNTFEYKGLDKKLNLGMNLECVAVENAPGGYYILSNELIETGTTDLVLTKVSADGNPEWNRKFGAGDADDAGASVVALPDGRIAMIGTMQLKTRRKMALIVVNSNGRF